MKRLTQSQKAHVVQSCEGISIFRIARDKFNLEKPGKGDAMALDRPTTLLRHGRKMVRPMIKAGTAHEIGGLLYLTSQTENALAKSAPVKKWNLVGLVFAMWGFLITMTFGNRSN